MFVDEEGGGGQRIRRWSEYPNYSQGVQVASQSRDN